MRPATGMFACAFMLAMVGVVIALLGSALWWLRALAGASVTGALLLARASGKKDASWN